LPWEGGVVVAEGELEELAGALHPPLQPPLLPVQFVAWRRPPATIGARGTWGGGSAGVSHQMGEVFSS